jgi:hypothetical protein
VRVSGKNLVKGDVNGDGNADFQITVLGGDLSAATFSCEAVPNQSASARFALVIFFTIMSRFSRDK